VLNFRRRRAAVEAAVKGGLHELKRLHNIDIQSKKRLISEEPREVFDLMRWMPGNAVHRFLRWDGDGDSVCAPGLRRYRQLLRCEKLVAGKNRDWQLPGRIQSARADQGYHDQYCARLV